MDNKILFKSKRFFHVPLRLVCKLLFITIPLLCIYFLIMLQSIGYSLSLQCKVQQKLPDKWCLFTFVH